MADERKKEIQDGKATLSIGLIPDAEILAGIATAYEDQAGKDFERDWTMTKIDGKSIAEILLEDPEILENNPGILKNDPILSDTLSTKDAARAKLDTGKVKEFFINPANTRKFFDKYILNKIPSEKREEAGNYLMRHFHQGGLPHFMSASVLTPLSKVFQSNGVMLGSAEMGIDISTSVKGFSLKESMIRRDIIISEEKEAPPEWVAKKDDQDRVTGDNGAPMFTTTGTIEVDFVTSEAPSFPKLTVSENSISYGDKALEQIVKSASLPVHERSNREKFRKLAYEYETLQSKLLSKLSEASIGDEKISPKEEINSIRIRMQQLKEEIDKIPEDSKGEGLEDNDLIAKKRIILEQENVNQRKEEAKENEILLFDLQKQLDSLSTEIVKKSNSYSADSIRSLQKNLRAKINTLSQSIEVEREFHTDEIHLANFQKQFDSLSKKIVLIKKIRELNNKMTELTSSRKLNPDAFKQLAGEKARAVKELDAEGGDPIRDVLHNNFALMEQKHSELNAKISQLKESISKQAIRSEGALEEKHRPQPASVKPQEQKRSQSATSLSRAAPKQSPEPSASLLGGILARFKSWISTKENPKSSVSSLAKSRSIDAGKIHNGKDVSSIVSDLNGSIKRDPEGLDEEKSSRAASHMQNKPIVLTTRKENTREEEPVKAGRMSPSGRREE